LDFHHFLQSQLVGFFDDLHIYVLKVFIHCSPKALAENLDDSKIWRNWVLIIARNKQDTANLWKIRVPC
jgi:hypothetical protein